MHPSLHSVLHGFPLCERHFHLSRKSKLKFHCTVAWKMNPVHFNTFQKIQTCQPSFMNMRYWSHRFFWVGKCCPTPESRHRSYRRRLVLSSKVSLAAWTAPLYILHISSIQRHFHFHCVRLCHCHEKQTWDFYARTKRMVSTNGLSDHCLDINEIHWCHSVLPWSRPTLRTCNVHICAKCLALSL